MEIVEMKRIFSAVEPFLVKSTSACLAVTSAVQGEGKTSVTAGLSAIAAQQLKKKVLTIDLNWRAPKLHKYFGLDQIPFEKFSSGAIIGDLIQNSGLDSLDILSAMQSTASEAIKNGDENAIFSELIKQARNSYDIIFIDTSAIFPANRHMMDPVAISKIADGVVMVVLANVTPRQQVKRARTILDTAGVNVLGTVVNQWKNPIAWTISRDFTKQAGKG